MANLKIMKIEYLYKTYTYIFIAAFVFFYLGMAKSEDRLAIFYALPGQITYDYQY